MAVALVRYDAARKAIAAAHRVDEVKQIRDKAEAVRVYAKQARDLEMQNMAAEIRLRAERRAGQLLVEMQRTGQRQAKDRGRPKKLSGTSTLPQLGLTRDQSSKWQQLAGRIDEATFERALIQTKQKNLELTTAALLREVKEVMRPMGSAVEPDINVIAAELIRDIESVSRKEKLKTVVQSRQRLNPTIHRRLIAALENAASESDNFKQHLSRNFKELRANGKAYQRLIRERMAEQSEPDIAEKRSLAADFENAVVRQISYDEAKNLILGNEWLGNMGITECAFGLFFGRHLAGTVCFGRTAGASSICGPDHEGKVVTLCRGACVHWAHHHSASFLISAACREMTKKGYNVFVAYSDPGAGEVGTVYQANNFLYCGMTRPKKRFRTPDGKIYDGRKIQCLTRDRTGGDLRYKRTRADQKRLLIEQGCEFLDGTPKHRYVGIYGDRRMKRMLRLALKWEVSTYPKRQRPSNVTEEAPQPAGFDLPIPSSHPQEDFCPGA
jgi:hypothetical protein